MNKAMEEKPWSIMGFSMDLRRWIGEKAMEEVEVNDIAFWIQVHNLPIELMMKRNVEIIGERLKHIDGSLLKMKA
ncbi:hypothetical protein CRYUN_Cryun32bG0052200 [Craigia yunnanensis]